jgi:hypothetical protein
MLHYWRAASLLQARQNLSCLRVQFGFHTPSGLQLQLVHVNLFIQFQELALRKIGVHHAKSQMFSVHGFPPRI